MWETYRIKLKNHSVLRNGNWPFTVWINGSIDCKMFAVEYFFLIQVRNFLRQNTIFFSVWSPKPQIYFPFKRTKIHSYYHVNLTLALGFFSHAADSWLTPPRMVRISLKSWNDHFLLKMMVKSGLEKKYFEIPRAPSKVPANQPGQFSLSGQIFLDWAAATLKEHVEFQNIFF